MKNYILFLIVLSICPFVAGSQQYNIIRQGVCWTTPTAVDSSLTRLVYVSVSGAGPISVNYVNAGGVSVDVSSGGTFEMGYCGCCAPPVDSTAIDVLYYTDGDSILDRDTILYKNYYSHAFLSGNGNDFTGRIGNFNRPFLSPWEVQDLYPDSNNLQFVGYRGDYSYSGVGAGNEFTRADTFTLFDLSASTYSMLSVTGSNSSPFITDRTLAGSISTPKIINIFAPNSGFMFSDAFSLGIPIGVYNAGSKLSFTAQSLTSTDASGRAWGVQSAAQFTVLEVDEMRIGGQVAISVTNDFTVPAALTTTRAHRYKIGSIYAGGGNTTDFSGVIRYQMALITDSLSAIEINIGSVNANTSGLMLFQPVNGGAFKRSSFTLNVGSYYSRGAVSASAGLFNISTFNTSTGEISNSTITAKLERAVINGSIFNKPPAEPLVLSEKSTVNIEIGVARSTAVSSVGIDLENITLRDSSVFRIHCDYCEFEPSTIPIRLTLLNIPQGSRLEISGVYVSRGRAGEMIQITGANTDLSGVVLKDAIFINNGVAEWIEASSLKSITVENAWSNSSVTVNVDLVGRDFWGFYNCDSDYVPLQEILDGICDSIAAVPADLNVAEDNLTANGSHVTDWLDHTIEFDFTGAPLDTIVYRWPSPDGEVQGLYISDGAQEMALLMNDVRGTDFANIINYNLADEIVFGNTGDTTVTQADKWFADIQNLVRADTVRSVMVIDSDNEIKLKYVPISGRVSDTTDGSGDIVIPLGVTMGSVNFTAIVGARGTTFQQAQVISNTATNITVRVLDDSGAPITGTAVVVDWMVMDY